MSRSTPGQRGVLIGRLGTAPTVCTSPAGARVATIRLAVNGTDEYLLTAFGRLVDGLSSLATGQLIYAEGRWQAREGSHPEMVIDTLTPLTPHRSHDQRT